MYDISQLEDQWKSYNKKRRKPFYVLIITVVSFSVLGVSFFMNKDFLLSKYHSLNAKVDVADNKPIFMDKPIDTLALKHNEDKETLNAEDLKPVTIKVTDNNPMNPEDVLIELQDTPVAVTHVNKKISKEKQRQKMHIEVRDAPVAATHVKKKINKEKPRKKMHLEIIEMSGASAMKDVKNRFSMAPDPDDSLFLARNYYKEKKYSKAAYWALQTNKLNGEIEESWLIFAKSKAKTGHKNEAIRVLSQYVSKSNSTEARKLLYKLKK